MKDRGEEHGGGTASSGWVREFVVREMECCQGRNNSRI